MRVPEKSEKTSDAMLWLALLGLGFDLACEDVMQSVSAREEGRTRMERLHVDSDGDEAR